MNIITPVSPPAAQSASQLLRRIGFMALAIAPLFFQLSRRGFVIIVPFGAVLIIIARLIETDGNEPFKAMRASLMTMNAWPTLFFIGWAGASLIWTPFPGDASIRYFNLVALTALIFATIQSLNEHTRTANLHLLPIGLGASFILELFLYWQNFSSNEPIFDTSYSERLSTLSTILMVPVTTWLLSRKRILLWAVLLIAEVLTLFLLETQTALIALLFSLGVYYLNFLRPKYAQILTLLSTAFLMLIAPLLPFLLRPATKWFYGTSDLTMDSLRAWGRLVQKEPLRLLTGHGFDVTMRAKTAGLIEPMAPRGLLFEIWYELGFLGVAALVCIFVLSVRFARQFPQHISSGIMASMICWFTFAAAGLANMQAWWLTLVGLLIMLLVSIAHGQYQTRRPISMYPHVANNVSKRPE
jgi:hypothetical protein